MMLRYMYALARPCRDARAQYTTNRKAFNKDRDGMNSAPRVDEKSQEATDADG